MEIRKSTIVRSTAGRDKGELFCVISTEGEYAFIANGKNRRIERPKRKKQKHLRFEKQCCGELGEKLCRSTEVTNKEIRKGLAEFTAYPAKNMEVCQFG